MIRRLLALAVLALATPLSAQDPVPNRTLGVGPYARTVLRNVIYVDGTGAPAQGPVDIVLAGDRIAEIRSIGAPKAIEERRRAARGEFELDLAGHYVLPGFVDAHTHLHTLSDGQGVPSDYILMLWMAHGVTSVREVGSSQPIEWLTSLKRRSAANEIVAPRIDVYPFFHMIGGPLRTAEDGRRAMQDAKRRGADGVKFIGGAEAPLYAAIDEAKKIGLHTTMHLLVPHEVRGNGQVHLPQHFVVKWSKCGLRAL